MTRNYKHSQSQWSIQKSTAVRESAPPFASFGLSFPASSFFANGQSCRSPANHQPGFTIDALAGA
jgi:hypothetical protein